MHAFDELFERLAQSAFRSRFSLKGRDLVYAQSRRREQIERHARDMLQARLFVESPAKDGKQTPYRGHPVFVAQHATGTCCRSCLMKWHAIRKGRALTPEEEDYVVSVIMAWIDRQVGRETVDARDASGGAGGA